MSKYFTVEEQMCKCCGAVRVDDKLMNMLTKARELAGIPFPVTSWYRCVNHNKKVGGSPTSSHMKGLAVDIAFTDSHDLGLKVKSLYAAGFNRVGINYDSKFVHVDIDEAKAKDVLFKY